MARSLKLAQHVFKPIIEPMSPIMVQQRILKEKVNIYFFSYVMAAILEFWLKLYAHTNILRGMYLSLSFCMDIGHFVLKSEDILQYFFYQAIRKCL